MLGIQSQLFSIAINDKDVVYTPDRVASHIIETIKPTGSVLDPCKGDGCFYNVFPMDCRRLWCEIEKGRDFMEFSESIDWIIANPPYSTKIFLDFLRHSFDLADNVVFLVPTNKIFQSWKVMDLITAYGGIRRIINYGSGTLIGFPFGFSVGAFHFVKGYKGDTTISFCRI